MERKKNQTLREDAEVNKFIRYGIFFMTYTQMEKQKFEGGRQKERQRQKKINVHTQRGQEEIQRQNGKRGREMDKDG